MDAQTKEPLPGANILISNYENGTSCDLNGRFVFDDVPKESTLLISYLGYKSQEFSLKSEKPSELVVQLEPSSINMQEVVVTANRELQKRNEAPVAISRLSAKLIEDTKPVMLAEVINKVPGVYMLNYNNEQHGMSIRQPMGVSAYYLYMEDGLPLRPAGIFNHNALIEMNMLAVSAVEVVKGPSSSLYGSEAIGGAINFITHAPTMVPSAKIGFQGDQFGYRRIQFGGGAYLTKKLGVYVGGFTAQQRDSWQTYSDFNKTSVNFRADYFLSGNSKLIYTLATNNYFSQTGGNVDSLGFYSRKYSSLNTFSFREVDALRSRLTYQKFWNEDNELSVSTFFRNNTIAQLPGWAIRRIKDKPAKANGEINENSFKSYGLQMQNSTKINFLGSKLITGAYIDYSPNTYNAYYLDIDRNNESGIYTRYTPRPDSLLTDYSANLVNTAVYAQYELSPFDPIKAVIGLRYDRMDYVFDNHLPSSAFTGAPDDRNSFKNITPKIGLTYSFSPKQGMYMNYSRGFTPPGITQLYRGTKVPELKPAIFDNYEIGGWCWLLDKKVYLDYSFYQLNGFNEIVSYQLPDNSFENKNSGKTSHRGLEYGLNIDFNEQVSFRTGGTYAIHKFLNYDISGEISYSGKEMPTAPRWINNLEITIKPKVVKGLRFSMEHQRLSSFYKDPANEFKYEDKTAFGLKGVSILNFRTGYTFRGVEVFGNIINLSNELYANTVTRSGYGDNFTPAAPRTFNFGIQYHFSGK